MGKFKDNLLIGFGLMLGGLVVTIVGDIDLFVENIIYFSVVAKIIQTFLTFTGLYFLIKGAIKYGNI